MINVNQFSSISELLVAALPWLCNSISLTTAFCLSNHKVTLGRYLGVFAAIIWSAYGIYLGEISFLIANLIFVYIYASAIIKFKSKQTEYKTQFKNQEDEIKYLRQELEETKITLAYHMKKNEKQEKKNIFKFYKRAS